MVKIDCDIIVPCALTFADRDVDRLLTVGPLVFCTAVLVMSLLVWSMCVLDHVINCCRCSLRYKVAGSIVKYCWLMSVRD